MRAINIWFVGNGKFCKHVLRHIDICNNDTIVYEEIQVEIKESEEFGGQRMKSEVMDSWRSQEDCCVMDQK